MEENVTPSDKRWARRSITDDLGDKEVDVVISYDQGVQNEEYEFAGPSKRKRRLVLDGDMEMKIKNLYDRFKDVKNCSRLIAKVLDPYSGISAAKVANKLKHLGIETRKMLRREDKNVDDCQDHPEAPSFGQPINTIKRVSSFSKEEGTLIKELKRQKERRRRRDQNMTGHNAIEVTKTVLEVADVAWTAVESYHHHNHHHSNEGENNESTGSIADPRTRELEALREENRRLRSLLEANLMLFETLAVSAAVSHECPSDLYARLVSMVTSRDFLAQLKRLRHALSNGTQNQFPFKEPTEDDVQSVEVLIDMDNQEPSWWVLVTDDMIPSNVEEQSAIDNDHYIVVNEEHVVDAVAHFLAKCIMSNPKAKSLKPEELQKALVQELGALSKVGRIVDIWHAGKMFYTLSTWGLAFGGLYQARGALKIAAKGVHATSKVVLRAL